MSQHNVYPPPPPPPTSNANVTGGPLRQQRQRPSLATNLARAFGNASQTPVSSPSYDTATPFVLTPSSPTAYQPRTPSLLAPPSSAVSPRTMAMEPYDPRQWSGRQQASGAQMVFQHRNSGASSSSRNVSGMEAAMPSPPPPYSPNGLAAGNVDQARVSPVTDRSRFVASPLEVHRLSTASTVMPMSPSFPPPPSSASRHPERSSSGHRSLFNLVNLRKSTTSVDIPIAAQNLSEPLDGKPPGARRAASTGQLHLHGPGESSSVPQLGPARKPSPASTWKPGMPLPGPPPGPPPSGSRTQSLNRYAEGSSRSNSIGSDRSLETTQPRRLAVPSTLGPIPPTPADWVDPDADTPRSYQPLRIDTGSGIEATLTRRPAKRDSTGHGIRERRSRSRAAKDGAELTSPDSAFARPNDLVFSPIDGTISKRREQARPASIYSRSPAHPSGVSPLQSSTTSPPSTALLGNAVKPASDRALKGSTEEVSSSAAIDRPMSQVNHRSAAGSANASPLTGNRPQAGGSAKTSARFEPFLLQALERHRAFIDKEATAASDEERLELFANFMVHESRLRRDRYSEAYNGMAGEIVDLMRDMWRSYSRQSKRAATPSTSMSSFDPTTGTGYNNMPSSASSHDDFTPGTDVASEDMERSESRQWGEIYKPSLSPIPSMNVSSTQDQESSRGRAPSRWWEQSAEGSSSVGNPDRIEKSHRETKYMGVNAARLQDNGEVSPRNTLNNKSITPAANIESFDLGPNEYPPEKSGSHERLDLETPIPTPGRLRKSVVEGAAPLDVSRLVTLPPPYPRHYPAVKNKHPLLSDLRDEYRSLADNAQAKDIKDAYATQDRAIVRQQDEAAGQRRAQLRLDIQDQITNGSISFAEAARAEAEFDVEEAERGKSNARSNFDLFERAVAQPLNALLSEELEKANTCVDQLRVELESGNEVSDPNRTQEEGDELPERLEKLTLLKWFFETREQLHKEMYDLHADRGAKYAEVILTPYRIAKQPAKILEAETFFRKDSFDRQMTFAKDSLQRFDELQNIVELDVSRGVEVQLSAFWDIAPRLLELVNQIPKDMSALVIDIPEPEYNENPTYNDHPLQYLYSLLMHAQKSTYQFIESQINLLCLLHEVRTATTKSSLRLQEIERAAASPTNGDLMADMQRERAVQEDRLTQDLQEKVREVESQWNEALGEGLEECRARVRTFLEENGGWEEGLEG